MKSDDIRFRGIHTVSPVHINDVSVSIPISLLFTLNDAKRIITSILPHYVNLSIQEVIDSLDSQHITVGPGSRDIILKIIFPVLGLIIKIQNHQIHIFYMKYS